MGRHVRFSNTPAAVLVPNPCRTARREAGYLAGSSPGLETLHSDMSDHLLDTQHAEQLVEYLLFLRRKRDQCVSEIAAEFKELLQSRLLEDQRTPMLHTRRHRPRSAPGPPEGCSQERESWPQALTSVNWPQAPAQLTGQALAQLTLPPQAPAHLGQSSLRRLGA